MRYVLRQKMLGFVDGFQIKDEQSQVAFGHPDQK
jgi:uncharacterized protein YxjI